MSSSIFLIDYFIVVFCQLEAGTLVLFGGRRGGELRSIVATTATVHNITAAISAIGNSSCGHRFFGWFLTRGGAGDERWGSI